MNEPATDKPISPAPTLDDLVEAARSRFEHRFERPPTIVAAAPGRVNLIGEHTDYNAGFVLPCAIDRWVVLAAAPTEGDISTLIADDLNAVFTGGLRQKFFPVDGESPKRFANYVLGVAAGFRERGCAIPNIDCLIHSSIPIGSGLSSSAAIEVASALTFESLLEDPLDPLARATLCQQAEHRFAGTPCGVMDVLIASIGKRGYAMLIDCRTNEWQPVAMPDREAVSLLLVDTHVRHDLASSEYPERRQRCERIAQALGVDSLRDVTLAMLEDDRLTETDRKRAAHVVTENTRTLLASAALHADDLEIVGDLLFSSHDSLRELYVVSCPELDTIVDAANQFHEHSPEAVIGARMTGGGFGGCAIVLCQAQARDDVAAFIRNTCTAEAGFTPSVYAARAVDGARIVARP